MDYKIEITTENYATALIKFHIPFLHVLTSEKNSRWNTDGGKMLFSSGYCEVALDDKYPAILKFTSMGNLGFFLYNFFAPSGFSTDNGGGFLTPDWANGSLQFGNFQWVKID